MYGVSWLKNQIIYLLAFLSFLNCLPVLIVSLINMSLLVNLFGYILLMSAFVTPIASVLYIIITLWFIIKRRENYILSSIIIIVNAIYLIWGANYIINYFAKF